MKTITFVALLFALTACDRKECTSSNPVFANNPPSSKVYKDELLEQIKHKDGDVEYWFKEYMERDGKTYMVFHVQNNDLCAVAEILVTEWDDNIANIKKVKGGGYGGEVIGLQYRVEQDAAHTELIYENLDTIID